MGHAWHPSRFCSMDCFAVPEDGNDAVPTEARIVSVAASLHYATIAEEMRTTIVAKTVPIEPVTRNEPIMPAPLPVAGTLRVPSAGPSSRSTHPPPCRPQRRSPIGVGRIDFDPSPLRTVQADFPHTALQ